MHRQVIQFSVSSVSDQVNHERGPHTLRSLIRYHVDALDVTRTSNQELRPRDAIDDGQPGHPHGTLGLERQERDVRVLVLARPFFEFLLETLLVESLLATLTLPQLEEKGRKMHHVVRVAASNRQHNDDWRSNSPC
jgi:hypothetical protein